MSVINFRVGDFLYDRHRYQIYKVFDVVTADRRKDTITLYVEVDGFTTYVFEDELEELGWELLYVQDAI